MSFVAEVSFQVSESSPVGFLIRFHVILVAESNFVNRNQRNMENYAKGNGELTYELVSVLEISNYFRRLLIRFLSD